MIANTNQPVNQDKYSENWDKIDWGEKVSGLPYGEAMPPRTVIMTSVDSCDMEPDIVPWTGL